jgi:APA family basic amino acid/polyamine antiporter
MFIAVCLALQSVVITYGGWQSALYFSEEDRDPVRNLPRSMVGGVLLVLVIYLLVNLALLRVLPLPALASSKLSAADAAEVIFGARGGWLITLLSLISLPPLINAILMVGTRVLFALSRDVPRWSRAAAVNQGGTPSTALFLTAAGGALLAASGTFEKLVAVASFFLAANYFVCCLALVVLRRREPELPRPFRAWGYPWTVAVLVAGALSFLLGVMVGDTRTSLLAVALLAAGLGLRWWMFR